MSIPEDFIINLNEHDQEKQKLYTEKLADLITKTLKIEANSRQARVQHPQIQEHYGPGNVPGGSKLLSLFIKYPEHSESVVQNIFKKIDVNVKVHDLIGKPIHRLLSGTYRSYFVEITKGNAALQIRNGWQFYVTFSSTERASLNTKQTSPANLGICGAYTNLLVYDRAVLNSIDRVNTSDLNKSFMKETFKLLTSTRMSEVSASFSKSGSKTLLKESVEYTNELKDIYSMVLPGDVKMIGKDFGEAIALRWVLLHPPYSFFSSFDLPIASNTPLVDYSVLLKFNKAPHKTIRIEFSSKYEQGASPSLSEILSKMKTERQESLANRGFKNKLLELQLFTRKGVNQNILDVFKIMDSSGYDELKKILGIRTDLTEENVKTSLVGKLSKVKKESRIDVFVKTFNPFFQSIGAAPINPTLSKKTMTSALGTTNTSKYHSPLIYTLGAYIVKRMNADEDYSQILNEIARDIDVIQVYMQFHKDKVSFFMQEFEDSDFVFDYRANLGDSSNTGIRFKMIKNGNNTENKEYK
jgi:hypothetical protein